MPLIHWENQVGQPFSANGVTITPISQAIQIRHSSSSGGLIWNRPVSVVVQTPEGQEQIIPIHDETRIRQIAILGIGLLGGILIWLLLRKK
jgi:hypothetical protein